MKDRNSRFVARDSSGEAVESVSAFSYEEYRATYRKQERTRGSTSLPQRWALFREAKRRLEHGVPVGVLLRDVTWKLRALRAGEVRHV